MRARFSTSRVTGQSNADVLIALVDVGTPGHVYTYDDLAAALSAGSPLVWDKRRVQSAVQSAKRRLLRELQRTLYPVAGVGYRLSHGSDHSRLALVHEQKSQRQLKQAVCTLKDTRLDELTPTQRTLHEAHLAVTLAIGQQVAYLSRRQKAHDHVIETLLTRVEKLESAGQ